MYWAWRDMVPRAQDACPASLGTQHCRDVGRKASSLSCTYTNRTWGRETKEIAPCQDRPSISGLTQTSSDLTAARSSYDCDLWPGSWPYGSKEPLPNRCWQRQAEPQCGFVPKAQQPPERFLPPVPSPGPGQKPCQLTFMPLLQRTSHLWEPTKNNFTLLDLGFLMNKMGVSNPVDSIRGHD